MPSPNNRISQGNLPLWVRQVQAHEQGFTIPDGDVATESDSSGFEFADDVPGPGSAPMRGVDGNTLTPEEFLTQFWSDNKIYVSPVGHTYVATEAQGPTDILKPNDGGLGGLVSEKSSGAEEWQVVNKASSAGRCSQDESNESLSGRYSPSDLVLGHPPIQGPSLSSQHPSSSTGMTRSLTQEGTAFGELLDTELNLHSDLHLDLFCAPLPAPEASPIKISHSIPPHTEASQNKLPHIEKSHFSCEFVPSPFLSKPSSKNLPPAKQSRRAGRNKTNRRRIKRASNPAQRVVPSASNSDSEKASEQMPSTTSAPIFSAIIPTSYPSTPKSESELDETSTRVWTEVVNKKKQAALKKNSEASSTNPASENTKVSTNDRTIATNAGDQSGRSSQVSSVSPSKGKKKQSIATPAIPMELPPCLSSLSPRRPIQVSSPSHLAATSFQSRLAANLSPSRTASIPPSSRPASSLSPTRLVPAQSSSRPALVSTQSRSDPVSSLARLALIPSTPSFELEDVSSDSSEESSSSSIEIITDRPSTVATYREMSEESVDKAPVVRRAVVKRPPPTADIVSAPMATDIVPAPVPAPVVPVPVPITIVAAPVPAVVVPASRSITIVPATTPNAVLRTPATTAIVPVPVPAAVVPPSAPTLLASEKTTGPFIVKTEPWRKKLVEKQPEADQASRTTDQARDAHLDHQRRVLADAHLALVDHTRQYARRNPEIAFGNPNALPWPLGMPIITSEEYLEAARMNPTPIGAPAMKTTAGYTYWESESSHPRSAVSYPHLTQHTDQGMYVFTWNRMSEPEYDYLEASMDDPAKCWFNPPCCQHRHPYAPKTETPLHPVDSCCCSHDPSRCCPCLSLEMQNPVPAPGMPWGNIPDERKGHDFRDQPIPDSRGFRPTMNMAAQPVRTGYGYWQPPGSGEWATIGRTGHGITVPYRGDAHGVSGQYGPVHIGYTGQYARSNGPSDYFERALGQLGPPMVPLATALHGRTLGSNSLGQEGSLHGHHQHSQASAGQPRPQHRGSYENLRSPGSYQHGRPRSGPGSSMATSRPRPQAVLDPAMQPTHGPRRPEGVAAPNISRRQTTRPHRMPTPAFTFPAVTHQSNITGNVHELTPLQPSEISLTPAPRIHPPSLVPVSRPAPAESVIPVFNNRKFAVSTISNLLPAHAPPVTWPRYTVSFSSPVDFIRESSPDPLTRPDSAPMGLEEGRIGHRVAERAKNRLKQINSEPNEPEQNEPEQNEPEQTQPEQTQPECLNLQNLRISDSSTFFPDTPHEFFDARQEQNTSPLPSEKSDRPTTPGIATEPVTERTTPQVTPNESHLKSPEAGVQTSYYPASFDEAPGIVPPSFSLADRMQAIRGLWVNKPHDVEIFLTPVTNLSAKPSYWKSHKDVLSLTSPFLAAALQVLQADKDGIIRVRLHGGPRFNCFSAFAMALQALYEPNNLLSQSNIRQQAISGMGSDSNKQDNELSYSVHLAKVDFAICYASAGAFFGYSPVVSRGIQLILELLDWESADLLLGSCLLIGEYMLTVPEFHSGVERPEPAIMYAGQVGDYHLSNFHLNEIGNVRKALFKYMASNVMAGFKLYERAQATYYVTRIPHEIWTLPGSSSNNKRLEEIRYGGLPSYADLRPKRLDIMILSAMLITLPFPFFMNLIDEMKKAETHVLTLDLLKEVIAQREQRRAWALHILAAKKLPNGTIEQTYLEELAYREFVVFERAGDYRVSNAMVHRIWAGLDPPTPLPSRPMTLADLHISDRSVATGEGTGKPGLRKYIKGRKSKSPAVPGSNTQVSNTGNKGKAAEVPSLSVQKSTGEESTVQTPPIPDSMVETPPVPGSTTQPPAASVNDDEPPLTPKKKKNKKNRKKRAYDKSAE